ncbi:MAG: 50S ribosomal protein L25 [Chloroflexi bacterium]|nr:50S ribosomal protein L25 [Chloroflexota bacterium]
MPSPLELRAEPRAVLGKHVRRLRRQGIVPANIYGHGASRAIQATTSALEHLLAQGGRTGIVSIAVDGGSETALLKTIQRDPRSGHLLHIDFQAVSMEESVTSSVPLRFVGESTAVSKLGGVMMHPKTELRISARAVDLPSAIEVDVSPLDELHSAIHVSDLAESASYTILDAPEEVLATVLPPKVEAEEVEAAEEGAAEQPAAEEAAAEAGEGSEPEA